MAVKASRATRRRPCSISRQYSPVLARRASQIWRGLPPRVGRPGCGGRLPAIEDPRAVILVEGVSDKVAVETLAVRRGRDLGAEGVSVKPIGGAHAIGRFLDLYGPRGRNLALAGLCDLGEAGQVRRALERAGLGVDLDRAEMERLGFWVCETDLEDELVRALGAPAVEDILA